MKRKNFKAFIFCFVLIIFSSCIDFHDNINGVWFYTFTGEGSSTEFDLTPASFMCLEPGSNYTLDFGKFEYGKWRKNKDTIVLTNEQGDTKAFIIKLNNSNDLKLSTEPGVVCDFEMQPYSFDANAAKPFSLEDNKWRLKATHKESTEEIKMRLINHCKFWKDYFTWALDNNIETVDVRSLPTPIKIYGNGFALKEFDDLPANWKNYFYDSTDCNAANDILKNIFIHNDIAWAHSDNKYKMFIGAFEQLQQLIKRN